ncbi:hypothetical protein LJR235_001868 [Pararhizobium sp. LjRoot235]|uniref:hypothetical protein n=1 Tax=Pararhizobium sp. LjRoot235 TaxID=3342291 RepID=UPI003ECD43B8
MEKIADVVSFARICPALEMDTVSVTAIAVSQKIEKSNRDYARSTRWPMRGT